MKKWFFPILCALPFIGVVVWFIAGKNIANVATLGLVLACPLSHIFLMKHDHGKEKEHADHNKHHNNHL